MIRPSWIAPALLDVVAQPYRARNPDCAIVIGEPLVAGPDFITVSE
jgi:hypothetical protein